MAVYKTSKSKENILRRIRQALQEDKLPKPFPEVDQTAQAPIFAHLSQPTPEETFAYEFNKAGGHFVFCTDSDDFCEKLQNLAEQRNWKSVLCAEPGMFTFLVNQKLNFVRDFSLRHDQADACITDCEAAIARTGSLLFSSRQNHGRTASIYFPVHIVVLMPHNLVDDVEVALKMMQNKYGVNNLPSMINLNTGPSRTADIEKTLVTGVHGPKEVYCFFINE